MDSRRKTLYLVQGAAIAALYVALTFIANIFGLASGIVQVRLSEALTVLPVLTFAAVPGLFIGCMLANLLTGCALPDIVFGSLATLIGALGTYCVRSNRMLAPLPPIAANTLVVPFILAYVYNLQGTISFFMLTVCAGEVISCGLLGMLLLGSLQKCGKTIPWH